LKDEQTIRKEAENDVDPRVDLAVERTMLAMERTQLAWVRTVMSLITAGIAIDKGVAALHKARLLTGIAWEKNGHLAGLLLTIGGVVLMTFTTILFILRWRKLALMRGTRRDLLQPGILISIFIILIGGLAAYSLTFPW